MKSFSSFPWATGNLGACDPNFPTDLSAWQEGPLYLQDVGTHFVFVQEGVAVPEIRERLGMEDEEIERLLDRSGLPTKIHKQAAGSYNEGWVPQKG